MIFNRWSGWCAHLIAHWTAIRLSSAQPCPYARITVHMWTGPNVIYCLLNCYISCCVRWHIWTINTAPPRQFAWTCSISNQIMVENKRDTHTPRKKKKNTKQISNYKKKSKHRADAFRRQSTCKIILLSKYIGTVKCRSIKNLNYHPYFIYYGM